MHEPVDLTDMRLEGLALTLLQQSGIESMTEDESVKFLGMLTIHAVTRLRSIRGSDWTGGFVDTVKAKIGTAKRGPTAGSMQ